MRGLFTLFVKDFSKAIYDLTVMLTIYLISRYPGYNKFMLANRFVITFLMICWNFRPMYVGYVIGRKLCKKNLQVTENMTRMALKWIKWPLITPARSFFPEWLMTWKTTFSSWQWDKVGCFDQKSNVSETVRKTIYATNKRFFYFQKWFFLFSDLKDVPGNLLFRRRRRSSWINMLNFQDTKTVFSSKDMLKWASLSCPCPLGLKFVISDKMKEIHNTILYSKLLRIY